MIEKREPTETGFRGVKKGVDEAEAWSSDRSHLRNPITSSKWT